MRGHPSFWADLSKAPRRPSSTQIPPRSVSPSRTRRRSSHSRTIYYTLLLIHRRHTCPKRQHKWSRRRRRIEGGKTKPASHLKKKDDPSVLTIECTISQKIFDKIFYDVGSGVNIMSKVTYEYLFGNKPLYPTYMQLQMADQSI
jgi:hypothetical protein